MDFLLPILLSSALHFHFDTNQLEVPTDLPSANIVQLYTDSTKQTPHLGMIRRPVHRIRRTRRVRLSRRNRHVQRFLHHQRRIIANNDQQPSIQGHNDLFNGIIAFGTIFGVLYFKFKN